MVRGTIQNKCENCQIDIFEGLVPGMKETNYSKVKIKVVL